MSCFLPATVAVAQPGDRGLDTKSRILSVLFPLDVSPKPYALKMALRFGDADTQLVIVLYPGRKAEVIRYELADLSGGGLSQLIAKMRSDNPSVTDDEIAARVKVSVTRSAIPYAVLERGLDRLRKVRISPSIQSRVALDGANEYEFWFDTWEESVHYSIMGVFKEAPQDQLVEWMIKFRENMHDLTLTSPAQGGSHPN
jgi:hypothetical protein